MTTDKFIDDLQRICKNIVNLDKDKCSERFDLYKKFTLILLLVENVIFDKELSESYKLRFSLNLLKETNNVVSSRMLFGTNPSSIVEILELILKDYVNKE